MPGSASTLPQIADRDHAKMLRAAPTGKVPLEWQDQGEVMMWAWRVFGPPALVARAHQAKALADAFDWTNRTLLPGGGRSPRAPEWEEYLWCAEQATINVVEQLKSLALFAFGFRRRADADPVWVPGATWAVLHKDCDDEGAVRGPGVVYYDVRVISAKGWLAARSAEAIPEKGGRQPGWDYREQDRPIIERIKAGVADGTYRSHQDGARALAREAAGLGNEASKVKRLLTRF
jgi:hypothetical protein